jgi:hypothetical protein
MKTQADEATQADKKQIGLSEESRTILANLDSQQLISEMNDGMRLGLAIAIDRGLTPNIAGGSKRVNSHNMTSIDETGEIRLIVGEIFPEFRQVPSRAIEDLIEQGLALIGGQQQDLGELFTLTTLVTQANG